MSLGIQNFQPRCGHCKKNRHPKGYLNLEFVRYAGQGIVVRCRNCGHESVRYSRAVRRHITWLQRPNHE